MTASGRWVVVGRPDQLSHGGSLRARYLFRSLVERTGALSMYRPDHHVLGRMLRQPWNLLPGAQVGAAELLPGSVLPLVRRLMRLRVLDLHDLPVPHAEALGLPLPPAQARSQQRLTDLNVGAFERVVVVSDRMGELAGIPEERRMTIPNGSDTSLIEPGPWPEEPVIGLVSFAAPGRGIEHLIAAARKVRSEVPDVRLRLCLAASEPDAKAYLHALRRTVAGESWIEITPAVAYARLGGFLASCSVLAVPHPPGDSWDAAPPVKLFDCLSAGRPVVATPRAETRRIVEQAWAGLVARSDTTEALAEAIVEALSDEDRLVRMGRNARRAAEDLYDWRILSNSLAEAMLAD